MHNAQHHHIHCQAHEEPWALKSHFMLVSMQMRQIQNKAEEM